MYVSFSSATDRMGKFSNFNCETLFVFPGAGNSSCAWLNATVLSIILGRTALQELQIGSTIFFIAGTVRPYCDISSSMSCMDFPTNKKQTLQILAPFRPIAPTISLLFPPVTYPCSGLIIDASASYGFAGKKLSYIKWTITGRETFSVPSLQKYFDLFHSSEDSWYFVTVPVNSTLFGPGYYTITLTLQNCFGQVSTLSKNLRVNLPSMVPIVQLSDASVQFINRPSKISLLAVASASICGSVIKGDIIYTWQVYKGLQLQQNIVSKSLDVRIFELSPFTLEANTTFTVQISVASSVNPFAFSSAKVSVIVGVSGVIASLAGGSTRTVVSSEGFTLDASASYDIDYPTNKSALQYRWNCYEYSPVYLNPCPPTILLSNRAINVIHGKGIPVNETTVYVFAVVVSNALNASDSNVAFITVVPDLIPTANLLTVMSKVSASSKLILQGKISVPPNFNASALWAIADADPDYLTSIALSSTTAHFTAPSIYSFAIAIAPNMLSAGSTYTFVLAVHSDDFLYDLTASAEVIIHVNSPPTRGVLKVTPTTGTAFHTFFQMISFRWVDDISDYPLSFLMYYYTVDSNIVTIIKSASVTTSKTTILGQGLSSMNYEVTCVIQATDIFGDSGSVDEKVTVMPLNASNSALSEIVNSSLAVLWKSNDVESVRVLMSATLSTLNNVDCSRAPDCFERNREVCRSVANTCGVCFIGYIGLTGNSNTFCFTDELLQNSSRRLQASHGQKRFNAIKSPTVKPTKRPTSRPTRQPSSTPSTPPSVEPSSLPTRQPSGQPTSVPSAESYIDWDKRCPNSCNNKGQCLFFDENENLLTTCKATNFNCQARCLCYENWFGIDCSKTVKEIVHIKHLNDMLCSTFTLATSRTDMSKAVLQDQTSFILKILQDPTQLSSSGYQTCVSAYILNLKSYLGFAVDISSTVFSALSALLASDFYQESILDINMLIYDLTCNLTSIQQAGMVAGEKDVIFLDPYGNDYMRILLKSDSFRDILNSKINLPQTYLENFDDVVGDSISILSPQMRDPKEFDQIGMSFIKYSRNILRVAQRNFSFIDMTYYISKNSGSAPAIFSTLVTTHPPYGNLNFNTGLEIPVSGSVLCPPFKTTVTVTCPLNPVQIPCNGHPGEVTYNCSAYLKVPNCALYGTAAEVAACIPISHSEDHISCQCSVSNASYADGYIRLPLYTSVADAFTPFESSFRITNPTAQPTQSPTINIHVILYFQMTPLSAYVLENSAILIQAMRSGLADTLLLPLYTIGIPIFNNAFPNKYIRSDFNTLETATATNIRIDIFSVFSLSDIISRFNATKFADDFVSNAKSRFCFSFLVLIINFITYLILT